MNTIPRWFYTQLSCICKRLLTNTNLELAIELIHDFDNTIKTLEILGLKLLDSLHMYL